MEALVQLTNQRAELLFAQPMMRQVAYRQASYWLTVALPRANEHVIIHTPLARFVKLPRV